MPTICAASHRSTILNPSGSSREAVRSLRISHSGNFVTAVTESIVTVFSLVRSGISFVGTIDISDIVDAAGDKFSYTEGTFVGTTWNLTESLLFLSTADSLVGVVQVEGVPLAERIFGDTDEVGSLDSLPAAGDSLFSLKLVTVLILPCSRFLLCPSSECLYAVSQRTRMLLQVDWKNYLTRATRFLLPSLEVPSGSGSPCIRSVLPQPAEVDFSDLQEESSTAIQAVVCESADALLILYDTGVIRSFAHTRPAENMSCILPIPAATCMELEANLLAIVPSAEPATVCVFDVLSSTCVNAKWRLSFSGSIKGLCWSEKYLAVGSVHGLSVLNREGSSVLIDVSTATACKSVCMSLKSRWFGIVESKSFTASFTPICTSADFFSNCHSSDQTQLMISPDSLRLFTFPSSQWRHIPLPWTYVCENGRIQSAAVQINASNRFVLAVAERGFALWSCFLSSLTSSSRRDGRWEVLAEKSQELRIGKIEIFGFLSETVFFTKSFTAAEIVLWSVLKRIDLAFALSSVKVPAERILRSAADSARNLLVLLYPGRVDVYKLRPDGESYKLERIAKLPSDFPVNLRLLRVVSSASLTTILGLSEENELFLRTGERVCGNAVEFFSVPSFGRTVQSFHVPRVESVDIVEGEEVEAVHVLDSSHSSTESSFDDQPMVDPATTEIFFIGERDCKLCEKLVKCPRTRSRAKQAMHRGDLCLYLLDAAGNMSVWTASEGGPSLANRLEFAVRFSPDSITGDGNQVIAVSGEFGVVGAINGSDMHVSFSSCVHPLLQGMCVSDAFLVAKRLEYSPFFPVIMDMWLHDLLASSIGVLAKLEAPFDTNSLTPERLCRHSGVESQMERLLTGFFIASHFPSTPVFAGAVRKSEPHITFPLATVGAFSGVPIENIWEDAMRRGKLREAALLLVIVQEKTGPVTVRDSFAIPLFRESLIGQDYALAREIAHFHFSYGSRIRSPVNRDFSWTPSPTASSEDLTEELLRLSIEAVVVAHLSYLINESMDWLRLVRFAETLRLALGEWLKAVPKQEYLDLPQLVGMFQLVLISVPASGVALIAELLTSCFKDADWTQHYRALAIATGQVDPVDIPEPVKADPELVKHT